MWQTTGTTAGGHPVSAGTQRVSAHRPCQIHLPELQHGAKFLGRCNLRFDDSNPAKEKKIYIDSIESTVHWLGFDYGKALFASDYFDRLYAYAEELIEKGLAYVCSLPAEQIRAFRGTLTEPGKDSPFRDRPAVENLDLFRRMKTASSGKGNTPCGPESTWLLPTSICGIR